MLLDALIECGLLDCHDSSRCKLWARSEGMCYYVELKKPGIFVLEQIIQSGCESGIFVGSSIIDMDAGNPFGQI